MSNPLEELTKLERKFLEQENFVKNEHDVYSYQSADGTLILSLDFILLEYKQWLLDNGHVRELN